MAEWDLIECGYSAADETINFGARAIGDCENLYETCTLASVKHSADTISTEKPTINSVTKNGKLYISINRDFKVFQTLECNEVMFEMAFDEVVDAFCVIAESAYVFVCLRNGCVYGFVIGEESATLLFQKAVLENTLLEEKYFIDCYSGMTGNNLKLLLVTKVGRLYNVLVADLTSLNEEGKLNVQSDLVTYFDHYITHSTFNYPNLFVSGGNISVYNVNTQDTATDEECDLKKIYSMDKLLIGLKNSGELLYICSETLILTTINPEQRYKDFVAIPQYANEHHILAVTETNLTASSRIQLINCFGFDVIFSLNLTHDVYLITPENINDEIIYITNVAHNEKVEELRFTRIYETSPEKRLTKLLKKNCFEEAESFAKLFNLDMNLVRKARAQAIVDKTVCNEVDVDMLLELLNTISDTQFTLQCCLDVHSCCERLEDVKRVLEYGCRELPNDLVDDVDICTMYSIISDFLFRFDTYVALLNNRAAKYDLNEWFVFSGCDLIREIIFKLCTSEIQESAILYSRLDRKTISGDLAQHVQEILLALDNVVITDCIPFLHVFIPVSLRLLPSLLSSFVKWLCSKILQIEQSYPQDFPENAIVFANTVTKLLKIEADCDISKEICELTNLTDGLKQVQILKHGFRINVPLQKYLEGPKCFIRTLLSIDMEEQDYGSFLQNFLYKYMLDNNLVPDHIFLEEIADLVQYEEKYWVQVVPYILKCISSLETKLNAILVLMDAAQVPWSETLSSIFMKALNYSHPLVAEIENKIENHPAHSTLHKYKCMHLRKNGLPFWVRKIIYENKDSMLEDIKQLCRTTKEIETANEILITHFIEMGDLAQAHEILEKSTDEQKVLLCKNLIYFITTVINNEFALPELQKYCCEFLRPVFTQLEKATDTSFMQLHYGRDEEIIRNTYNINKTLGKNIKTHHLRLQHHKKSLTEDLIYDVVQEFENGSLDIVKSLDMITTISRYLSADKNDLLVSFSNKTKNFTVIHKTAEKMQEASTNSKSLCLVAILLLKHIGSSLQGVNQTFANFNETILPESSNMDLKIFRNGLRLADSITAKAILSANCEDLDACIEVLKWVQTTYFMLSDEAANIKKELYRGMFCSDLVAPSCNTFNSIKNVFNMYVDYTRCYANLNTKYLAYFNHDTPQLTGEQLVQEITFLPQTVADLCTQGQTLTAFKLITHLRSSLVYLQDIDSACIKNLDNIIINQCIPQLLQQVLSVQYLDADLAYDLLTMIDEKKVLKYIQQILVVYKVDVVKFEAVARVAYRILEYYKDKARQEKIMKIIVTCKWWRRFKNCSMRYEDFFKSTAEELAERLIQLKYLTGTVMVEFCSDFKLDLQKMLLTQLKYTLIYWKPIYVMETSMSGKRKLLIQSNENDLLEECKKISEMIQNKEKLFETINSLWPYINFYYYEVFNALLNLLQPYTKNVDNVKKSEILAFLKNYNRFNKPNEAEKGEWFTAFPDTQSLDPLSEFRLPFTLTLLTSDVWNLIRPEISLQTYKYWFEAVDILKAHLSKDEICCFVVKQVVTSGVLKNEEKEWVMFPKHGDLFEEIDVCVQHITDLKAATATLYHLMAHTPQGADLVKAAMLCYKYATKYKEQYPDALDIQRIYFKVHKQYLSYSAMHILHLNMLAEERYLKIVSDPNELIDALYMDERIIKKNNSVVLNFPDINKAARELSNLFGIDIHVKRTALLNNWLSHSTEIDLNSTLNFIPDCKPDFAADLTADNIKRAAYVCSGDDVERWRSYLIKKGLSETSPECKNYAYRAKALSCFCMITDPNSILELTSNTKDELQNFIAKLYLLSNLKYQGYNFDVETLDAANKKQIMRRLTQNSCPSNVRIMADLCMTYNIYNPKYWEVIMTSANRLNMFKELKEYIEFLKPLAYCSHKQFYIQAWQRIIDNVVNSACANIDNKEAPLENCVEALHSIQTCPVLYSLKFSHLVEKFIYVKRSECAAILLQYLNENDRNSFAMLIAKQSVDIVESLGKLQEYGIWGIIEVKRRFITQMK